MPVRIYTTPGTIPWTVRDYGTLIIECWGTGGGGASGLFYNTAGGTGSTTSVTGTLAAGGAINISAGGGGGGSGGVTSYFSTSSVTYSNSWGGWFFYYGHVTVTNTYNLLTGSNAGTTGGAGGSASGGNANNASGTTAVNRNGGSSPAGFYGVAGGTGGTYPGGSSQSPGGGGAGGVYYVADTAYTYAYDWTFGSFYVGSAGTSVSVAGNGGGGGSYSRSQFTIGDITPGSALSLTIGGGGAGSVNGTSGAAGKIILTWSEIPPAVTDVAPLSINSIAAAFLPLYGNLPAKPWSLGAYFAYFLQNQIGGTQFPNTRTLNYGKGIQSEVDGVYNQLVSVIPASPGNPIAFSQFFGTYQVLEMRYPLSFAAPAGPIVNTWAQWDTITFAYTGSQQIFYFYNARIIKIECWGASAYYYDGRVTAANQVAGGYSTGIYVNPASPSLSGGQLYVYVGGAPDVRNTTGIALGGYNGGGDAYTGAGSNQRGAGGGATDVRTVAPGSNPPRGYSATNYAYWQNPTTVTSLNSRIVTAGGGGGPAFNTAFTPNYRAGGLGGGLVAGDGNTVVSGSNGLGATQDVPGTAAPNFVGKISDGLLGYGGSSLDTNTSNVVCGGGGGWYGGGAGYTAGGGSGHIDTLNMLPTSEAPKFGGLNLSVYNGQVDFITNPVANTGSGSTNVWGNGYCRITILG